MVIPPRALAMARCEHEKFSEKKRCGLTDPKSYYQHCVKCGMVRFGRDDGPPKKRERVRLEK